MDIRGGRGDGNKVGGGETKSGEVKGVAKTPGITSYVQGLKEGRVRAGSYHAPDPITQRSGRRSGGAVSVGELAGTAGRGALEPLGGGGRQPVRVSASVRVRARVPLSVCGCHVHAGTGSACTHVQPAVSPYHPVCPHPAGLPRTAAAASWPLDRPLAVLVPVTPTWRACMS